MLYMDTDKWRLKANVSKSAVMVFSKNSVEGGWKWESTNFLKCQTIVI